MTSNQRLTATLYVLGVLAVIAIVSYASGQKLDNKIPLSERVLTECEIKDVSEESGTTSDVAALLIDAGWYGIAGDGGERLYSPACIGEDYIP